MSSNCLELSENWLIYRTLVFVEACAVQVLFAILEENFAKDSGY